MRHKDCFGLLIPFFLFLFGANNCGVKARKTQQDTYKPTKNDSLPQNHAVYSVSEQREQETKFVLLDTEKEVEIHSSSKEPTTPVVSRNTPSNTVISPAPSSSAAAPVPEPVPAPDVSEKPLNKPENPGDKEPIHETAKKDSASDLHSCVFCSENLDHTPYITPSIPTCGHTFCLTCLTKKDHYDNPEASICPKCRAAFDYRPWIDQVEAEIAVLGLKRKEEKAKRKDTILVIGLDADGCVFNKCYSYVFKKSFKRSEQVNIDRLNDLRQLVYKGIDFNSMDRIQKGCDWKDIRTDFFEETIVQLLNDPEHNLDLWGYNLQLLDDIVQKIRSQSYEKIVYLSSSLRQDAETDYMNAIYNLTPLFSQALPRLVGLFKANNGQPWATNMEYDPYVVGAVKADYMYKYGRKENRKDFILHAHKKHLQEKFPGFAIHYVAYDDKPYLYDGYIDHLKGNPDPDFTFSVVEYDGKIH